MTRPAGVRQGRDVKRKQQRPRRAPWWQCDACQRNFCPSAESLRRCKTCRDEHRGRGSQISLF